MHYLEIVCYRLWEKLQKVVIFVIFHTTRLSPKPVRKQQASKSPVYMAQSWHIKQALFLSNRQLFSPIKKKNKKHSGSDQNCLNPISNNLTTEKYLANQQPAVCACFSIADLSVGLWSMCRICLKLSFVSAVPCCSSNAAV